MFHCSNHVTCHMIVPSSMWQLYDSPLVHLHPDFEPGVYAILKGRVVQFMMRMKEVTVGRSSASSQVTFDLSLEGPAYKVSRKQVCWNVLPPSGYIVTLQWSFLVGDHPTWCWQSVPHRQQWEETHISEWACPGYWGNGPAPNTAGSRGRLNLPAVACRESILLRLAGI